MIPFDEWFINGNQDCMESAKTIDHNEPIMAFGSPEAKLVSSSSCASPTTVTHEQYIHAVREIVISRLNDETAKQQLLAAKLTYGSARGVRGICFPEAWENGKRHDFIEISASGEQSDIQLAGTTIHELAHCLAGKTAGHGRNWKRAARQLGLIRPQVGQTYAMTDFDPDLWAHIQLLPVPSDGRPAFIERQASSKTTPSTGQTTSKVKSCPLGIGTRGGKRLGRGSGSRLRLFICGCQAPVKARVARDVFQAMCLVCKSEFSRVK